MKKVIIIFLAALSVFAISCKKDSTNTSTVARSPVGFWKGQWSFGSPSTPPNQNYLWLLFRTDGTLRQCYDATDTTGTNKDSGTWSAIVNDSILSWTNGFGEYYHGTIRSNNTIDGIWGYSPGVDTAGQFKIVKQ